ncbi:V-type ATPase, V0 complex, 116kDa subunit family [Spinellus fusiger]|nr:V-type ATPase, V0 complex, 116kDa subunit family [Spinellus fusiger]
MAPTTLFRSEEMSHIQLYIPTEIAQPCVAELGELGKVQFRDLNPHVNAFQRAYVSNIRRLDEMERQCRFFQLQIQKADIPSRHLFPAGQFSRARSAQEVDDLEEKLKDYESRLLEMNSSYEILQRRYLQYTELFHVLRETDAFLREEDHRQERRQSVEISATTPLLESDGNTTEDTQRIHLGRVTGVIDRTRLQTFQRVLWRSLRGNLYMKTADIDERIVDPDSDEAVEKSVFAIFAHGTQVIQKIRKISESLGATLYTIDDTAERRREAHIEVNSRIEDLNNVLFTTKSTRVSELTKISENLAAWSTIVRKEKGIYHTMNLFNHDTQGKGSIAEGWCPTNDIPLIRKTLKDAARLTGTGMDCVLNEHPTKKTPPTYHRTNKFTAGFQGIINAYGIARYGEVNPGLFTTVSFPFLFAVMFGDVGHGALLVLFALYLILNEKKLALNKGEIFQMFFSGRYMMLMMGIFSIFTGMIYNDVFSLSLNLAPSGFDWPTKYNSTDTVEAIPNGNVYPFGLDPSWHGSENFLLFTNSYKMKQAIILGVVHMTFAICLNVFNHLHYKKKMFVWLEFVPQILFMESIFGYLIFCIMYKWSVNWWEVDASGHHVRNSPPNLLNMLIYMFLTPGTVNPEDQLFPGQGSLQGFLILVAVVCVPWMWLGKPFYLKRQHEKHQYTTVANEETHSSTVAEEEEDEEEEFEFSEVMIHQTIHTIEFCLNCISNTASYLRLWALSLAHAQLSSVLWDMTLKLWFNFTGTTAVIGLVVGFSMWFVLTLGILLGMEGLSAFLHALRLHWVEFDGKFYMGDGIAFEPFTFNVEDASEE